MQLKHAGGKGCVVLKLVERLLPSADMVISVSDGDAGDLERRVPRVAGFRPSMISASARRPSGRYSPAPMALRGDSRMSQNQLQIHARFRAVLERDD